MSEDIPVSAQEIDALYARIKKDAEGGGYHLNQDIEFTRDLLAGLLLNQNRYGYRACPCRLAEGVKEDDMDIICPCNYRDQDVVEYGSCYCGLYVSQSVLSGLQNLSSIPERRPSRNRRLEKKMNKPDLNKDSLPFPVWRCSVCGYLCARDGPPEICPICKAQKERFERFI